jgi:predicted alpha/beta hydrolase family esterase
MENLQSGGRDIVALGHAHRCQLEVDMTTCVLFIQGGGKGAHSVDAALADSLKRALGPEYDVRFPQMPDEADPNVASWKQEISSELSHIPGTVILVAHSMGGAMLLRYLSDEKVEKPIAGLFLLAAPSWDEDHWNFDDLKLPRDLAGKLAAIPRLFFYHCRDDDVVPFNHLALHGSHIPQAVIRAIDHGGHQFGNDLTRVAMDIRAEDAA